ncbi:ABC transporter permease [Bacteroides rodentium]
MNTYRGMDARKAQRKRRQEIGSALSQCPFIECWYSNYENILSPSFNVTYQNSKGEKATLKHEYVSPDFFKLYGIKVVEGDMPEYESNENDRKKTIAVNRSALKALHYDNLDGAMIIEDYKERNSTDAAMIPISAIVEDYYNGHLCSGIQPTIFEIYPIQSGDLFQISYTPGRLNDLLKFLRDLEYRIYGSDTFEYSLLEDNVKAIYQKDKQVATIYSIFSCTTIAISCLGLFGISLFDIRQRYREISIRKINGAQLSDLYPLLFRKYIIALAIAFLLAVPLAYYIINEYTKEFTVKASLSIGIFAIGLAVVTFISLGTLFWQIRKAANINPAQIMKTE